MNYRKLKLVLMILIFTLVTTGFSNSKNNYDIIDEIYSRIHTEEWKALSKEERMEEINLSDEFINNLNANEFTYALLNYPFMTDFLVLDDTKEFPAHLIKDSNLIARFINDIDDPLLLLVDYHNTLDSRQVNQFTPYLVQDEIISKLSKVKSLAKKSSIESIDFLKKLNDSSFHLKYETDSSIIKQSCHTTYGECTYATVTTPRGSNVSVIRHTYDFSAAYKAQLNSYYDNAYPNATRLASATPYYNCHSYAWYSASTSNRYWMNNPSAYMSDGSYTLNSGLIQAGNKTFYFNSDHSGIVTYVGNTRFNNVKVTSKWGAAGLYNHYINDSPYPTGNRFYK